MTVSFGTVPSVLAQENPPSPGVKLTNWCGLPKRQRSHFLRNRGGAQVEGWLPEPQPLEDGVSVLFLVWSLGPER